MCRRRARVPLVCWPLLVLEPFHSIFTSINHESWGYLLKHVALRNYHTHTHLCFQLDEAEYRQCLWLATMMPTARWISTHLSALSFALSSTAAMIKRSDVYV